MKKKQIRLGINIAMTLVSIFLMGGNYFFSLPVLHEVGGVFLFLLWIVHIILNRYWYHSLFFNRISPFKMFQILINCSLLILSLLLMVSGIFISVSLFSFLRVEKAIAFARDIHLVSSHWYFIFMSLHIGLHLHPLIQIMAKKRWALFIAILFIPVGLYIFVKRNLIQYLFLQNRFFFFDVEQNRVIFFLEYILMLLSFALIGYGISRLMIRAKK